MATAVALVQRKLGKHSGCSLGCKAIGTAEMVVAACQEWVAEGPSCLPCPEDWHRAQGQVLIQQHKVVEVPGLLSLQQVANARTMKWSGVA